MSFTAMTNLSLLTVKVENSRICFVGTRVLNVHDEVTIYFDLKSLIRSKASNVVWNKLNNLKSYPVVSYHVITYN